MEQRPLPLRVPLEPSPAIKQAINISVTVRSDGKVSLVFGRLDLASRRMLFEQVGEYSTQYPGGAHEELLCEAAAYFYDQRENGAPF